MREVINFINNLNISKDEYVVLACSYGPDSMCLLDLLRKCGLKVVVAHVNHKVRSESDEEYRLLEEYCKKSNIPFEGMSILGEINGNFESKAREIRYNFFEEILTKYNANYLFTAHHGDDLVETILMRIGRGASFGGYAGFSEESEFKGKRLVRPLIFVTKKDILEYNEKYGIVYANDYTNFERVHTRNKIRLDVLPVLKEINPKIHEKFIKFSHTIGEYNDYVEKEVISLLDRLYSNNRLDLDGFNSLPLLLKKHILCTILSEIYRDDITYINDKHFNLIFNLIDGKPNGYVCLPNGVKVYKYYNSLIFNEEELVLTYAYIFDKRIELPLGVIEEISSYDGKSNYYIRLSSDEVKLPLHVRTRKLGDFMDVKNMNGTKKIKSIFIDEKVPLKIRDSYPLVCDDEGNILWVPGVKKSKFDKQMNESYDIILKYVKKEK